MVHAKTLKKLVTGSIFVDPMYVSALTVELELRRMVAAHTWHAYAVTMISVGHA